MVWPWVNERHHCCSEYLRLGETFGSNALDELLRLVARFKVPLQGTEAETDKIHQEFTETMDFATR